MKGKDRSEHAMYRNKYLKHLSSGTFPWECAYYYYTCNINRIDIMSFREFKDDLTEISKLNHKPIRDRIYDVLDSYFNVQFLISKTGREMTAI
jgi:hypothetical protein